MSSGKVLNLSIKPYDIKRVVKIMHRYLDVCIFPKCMVFFFFFFFTFIPIVMEIWACGGINKGLEREKVLNYFA